MAVDGAVVVNKGRLSYCERFLALLVDLLSQLPTRRYAGDGKWERWVWVGRGAADPVFYLQMGWGWEERSGGGQEVQLD